MEVSGDDLTDGYLVNSITLQGEENWVPFLHNLPFFFSFHTANTTNNNKKILSFFQVQE